jgi:hypothetical protein
MNHRDDSLQRREEWRLMVRLFYLLRVLDELPPALYDVRPRLSRDLDGAGSLLQDLVYNLETRVHQPGRHVTWQMIEAKRKRPAPSVGLLVRLLRTTRRAASQVLSAHNAEAVREGKEACDCMICNDVLELRWFLGCCYGLLKTTLEHHVRNRHEPAR